jgi:ubiquinone/menaquinone biosynthesis C-methylase UbiE
MQSASTPSLYPAPLNHHPLYVPSASSPLPFPNSYFDAIVSRSISTILDNEEWAPCFYDSMRVLKSGGQLEVLSLDAHISREGPKLSAWVDQHITSRLEAHGLSMQPSDTVLDTMDIVGLEGIRRARVALPAHSAPSASTRDTIETSRMMTLLGHHFYQNLYARFLHVDRGEEWFWEREDIVEECDRQQVKMILTISCARKPTAMSRGQSFLSESSN